MERRDLMKAAGTLAAAAAVAGVSPAVAQTASPLAGGNALVEITPPDPDAFIAGRFAGKTIIVTGSARGMGAAAAIRLGREGANVVGIDWLKDLGEETDAAIRKAGGKSIFVHGDIGEAATANAAIEAAVQNFGGLDGAINNAGVMDGVYSRASPSTMRSRNRSSSPQSMRQRRNTGARCSAPTRWGPS